jgi:hypothetical protein
MINIRAAVAAAAVAAATALSQALNVPGTSVGLQHVGFRVV